MSPIAAAPPRGYARSMVTGSCLCGAVSWSIDAPFDWMAHCHCSMCRRAHGAAFATFVTYPASAFRWTGGTESIVRYESSPGSFRAFCGRCGSKLPGVEPFAYSPAGPLEGDFAARPSCHLFVGSKASWHDITDGAERHDALPPGGGGAQPDRRNTDPAPGKVRGACLCGAVAYELDGPLDGGAIVCCHCSRCRRARSAAHATNLFVEARSFRWLRGEDRVAAYKVPEAERFRQAFCARCGSPMPTVAPAAGRAHIPAGTLEDDPGVREGLHIFVGSKAAWHEITDALPRHREYPPAPFPPVARTRA